MTGAPGRGGKSARSILSDTGRVTREAGSGGLVTRPRGARASGRPRAEEAGKIFPRNRQRDGGPAHTLISDVWPPELGDRKHRPPRATQFVVIGHGSPRTLRQSVHATLLQEGLLGLRHRESPHHVPHKPPCTTAPGPAPAGQGHTGIPWTPTQSLAPSQVPGSQRGQTDGLSHEGEWSKRQARGSSLLETAPAISPRCADVP